MMTNVNNTNANNTEMLHSFLSGLRENELVEKLLENMPENIYFFVKDVRGRFMMANRLFWEKIGLTHGDQIIGKTDYDFFWALQAQAYLADDAEVLRTGQSQYNKLEIMPTADGLVDWYRTTKIPLRGPDGPFAGLLGIIHDLRSANSALQPYRTMEPVIRHILENYAQPVHARDLAAVSGMSLPRFTRRFKREFQVTPGRYLAMVRLNVACRLLASTRKSIADIALESGFYDHSFFTKQFVKYKGMTPKEFRSRFRDLPDQKRFFPLGVIEGDDAHGEGGAKAIERER
jgi:PAS domain S-box-containing protein